MDLKQVQDLFNQGVEAYKDNELELAIQLWRQIEKTSDEVKEIYAKAQFGLGLLFKQLKRYQEAEEAYNNVNREDSAAQYAKAQINLGSLLNDLKRFNEAERCYTNISREDSVAAYATAKLNLGLLLEQQQRFEEAEKAYKNVSREDSLEDYATAQVNLGSLLDDLKRFNAAEQCYKNISREDSLDLYARAQFNLGFLFKQQQRFEEAEQAYKNVRRENLAEAYAKAQFNLGNLFDDLKRFNEAEQAYKNVSREDSVEQYAKAQINLGNLFADLKRFNEAEQAYKNVSREDSAQQYAFAQWNLYWSFRKNKDYLINIEKEHDLEIYAKARFVLGELEENLDAKHEYWQQIPQDTEQYKKESYQINVVKSISKLENPTYQNELFEVFQNISEVLKILFVNNQYEQSIAHYTNLSVSKLLLSNQSQKPNDFQPKSKLRLNTINLMNHPEEGLLINKLLGLEAKITTQDSAFIACFTLHHDSLNQFRLYGKENKEEASGLSLVLNKKFFSLEHNTARIYEKDSVVSQYIAK